MDDMAIDKSMMKIDETNGVVTTNVDATVSAVCWWGAGGWTGGWTPTIWIVCVCLVLW
jgi:hypothetical protein